MKMSFKANENVTRIIGRTKVIDDIRYINYSCSGIEFEFTGTSASVVLITDRSKWDEINKAWVAVFIDDEAVPSKRFSLERDEDIYKLYESSIPRKVKIRLMKMSEAAYAKVGIKEIITEGTSEIVPTRNKKRRIEFIGDSLTCGYGIEGASSDLFTTAQENPWEAYAAKTARYFDADFNLVSWSGIGIISFWTDQDEPNTKEWLMPDLYKYTDGGMDRALGKKEYEVWDNRKFEPNLIIINLGTNDSSYTKGIREREENFSEGFYKFLEQVRACNPHAEIICTLGAMVHELCPEVETTVNGIKSKTKDKKIHTMFFEVQAESDGIGANGHPSLKTQDKMSKKLIEKVKEVMEW